MSGKRYPVFLSHNSADKVAVRRLAEKLREQGIEPFLDEWRLVPGDPWQESLEKALDQSETCAVFLGAHGQGSWRDAEMRMALDLRARSLMLRVFAVLLPGAPTLQRGDLPAFLSGFTWVDFRSGLEDPDAFQCLLCGIRGEEPGPLRSRVSLTTRIEAFAEGMDRPPYPGLKPFGPDDFDIFYGRAALTQYLVESLRNRRFLAVVGPSGIGKSSVVRAGLIPALQQGSLPGSSAWITLLFKPSRTPLKELAGRLLPYLADPDLPVNEQIEKFSLLLQNNDWALARNLQPTSLTQILIVIDQLEDLFTQLCPEVEKQAFLNNLLNASELPSGKISVVIILRADFYAKIVDFPDLARRIESRQVFVTPMAESELWQAITYPARQSGLFFEDGLVNKILRDMHGHSGALPLLQQGLLELRKRREGPTLTDSAYKAIHGINGAIARWADSVYESLTPAQQSLARRIFVALVQPGDGTGDTRRRVPRKELVFSPNRAFETEEILDALILNRLLTTDCDHLTHENLVEIAHEALLREWPHLRKWLETSRASRLIESRLQEQIKAWLRYQRDPGNLLRGAELAEVELWAKENDKDLGSPAKEYLEESLKRRKLEILQERLLRHWLPQESGPSAMNPYNTRRQKNLYLPKAEKDSELSFLLEELDRPGTPADAPRRILICRRVLRLLPAEPPTPRRVAVLVLLGSFLGQTTRGFGRSHDEALATYREALAAMERLGMAHDRARTLVDLSYLHLIRTDGSRAENTELAIRAGEAALALVSREMDFEAWGRARLNLAIAYGRRTDNGAVEGQEKAISLLLELLGSLSLPQHAEVLSSTFHNLTSLYLKRRRGDREDNLEQVLTYGDRALELRSRDRDPRGRAMTLHNLAAAWAERFRGDRAENLEKAISLLQEALAVRTREAAPWDWADTMDALGSVFADRVRGQRADNLEAAIHCHQEALTVRRRRVAPDAWVESQINRALVYLERIRGDRASNIERSIRISREVLTVLTRDDRPFEWAMATTNLGQALQASLLGDRSARFEESIRLVGSALEILNRDTAPREWARAMNTLGNGYSGLLRGDRTENLERAISLYEEALEVRGRDTLPWEWAETTHNLAAVYGERRRGSRPEALEKAISLSEACLSVYTRDFAPDRWASALEGIGTLYLDRYEGIREENVEKAISVLEQAREVHTRDANPVAWAYSANQLGVAYWRRVRGDREDNLDKAIDFFTRALEVRIRRRAPAAWAETQNNLGLAQADRHRENLRENRRQAVQTYRRALEVQTLEANPEEHRRTCRNLGNLHFQAGRWRDAAAAYAGALTAGEALYAEGTTPQARSAELWQRLDVPLRAAYALTKRGRRAEAVRVLEASRAREVRERLERGEATLRLAPEPERSEIVSLRQRIAGLEAASRRPAALSTREYLALSKELREARAALRDLLERLRPIVPDLLSAAPDALPSGLADPVVYLITTLHGTLALVLHPGAEGDSAIDALFLERLREEALTAIIQGTASRTSWLAAALAATNDVLAPVLGGLWEEMRSAVVVPLVRHLRARGYERALLVPCGPLGLLPLPAMAVDEMAFAFAPSARIPLELAMRSRPAGSPMLAAVGNPPSSAGPLPLAALEVEGSAEHFPAASRRLLLGRAADRASVLSALPGATHLHFACHGVFDLGAPLGSALLLAGEDRLTVRDLLDGRIDLSAARLAVLSACQTAMSDQDIPDELLGFPSSFLQAGVPVVLGTLWPVGDVAATLLLSDFYRRHLRQGDDPVQALRGAQTRLRDGTLRELGLVELLEKAFARSGHQDRKILQSLTLYRRKPKDSRPFAAPHHWAGFVVWGGSA